MNKITIWIVFIFSMFSCKAELQSSMYGYRDPLAVNGKCLFWEYVDNVWNSIERSPHIYIKDKYRYRKDVSYQEAFFNKELNRASTDRDILNIIATMLNVVHQKMCLITPEDFLKNKYGQEGGSLLYKQGLAHYKKWESGQL